MTSLVDLMNTEAPDRIELSGTRLAGSVEVIYGLSSHMTPVIRFGSDRFAVHTSVVTVNGIECEVAGVDFYRRSDGKWQSDTYGNVRRNIDYARSVSASDWDVSYKTTHRIYEALEARCPELWEQWPEAFTRLGVGSSYADAASFDRAADIAAEDLRLTKAFAALYRAVEDGAARVVPVDPKQDTCLYPTRGWQPPDEICWDHPSRDSMPNHDVQKGRGAVYGLVVGQDGVIGFAVDRSGSAYKPDTYYGPLLVPIDLARHPKS